MKQITQEDIDDVIAELTSKRKEFESSGLTDLEKRLKWIQDFFNSYVPELEERFMAKKELTEIEYLPNELRIHFYLIFPEHGLNMANYSQELAYNLWREKKFPSFANRVLLSHNDL